MTARQQHRRKQARAAKAPRGSLAATGLYAPLMGLWGALLGGLPVLVVPGVLFAPLTARFEALAIDLPLQPLLAGLSGLVMGGVIYALAAGQHRRALRRTGSVSLAARALGEVWPIDPARDLGTDRLDDPIETMPFATPAWRDADLDAPPPAPAPAPAPEPVAAQAQAAQEPPAPRALDLSDFAELPGRNAVWVEDAPAELAPAELATPPQPFAAETTAYAPVADWSQVAPAPETTPAPAPLPEPGTAALARLRSVPPSELSLPQMVERFAVALHQHRTSPAARALTASEIAAREAALAEALRALAALSGGRPGDPVASAADDPLRAALSQLQSRRGAA